MAFVHLWEKSLFKNPIPLERKRTMKLAKIGSVSTYLKTLKELNEYGYIRYYPSKSRLKRTCAFISGFEVNSETIPLKTVDNTLDIGKGPSTCSNPGQEPNTHSDREKTVSLVKDQSNSPNLLMVTKEEKSESNPPKITKDDRQKITATPAEKGNASVKKATPFKVPKPEEVEQFFEFKSFDRIEAQRFFNYFESNGWKVGGKAPMKNWKAAARNWMLNTSNYGRGSPSQKKTNYLFTQKDKDYGEPL